MSKKIYVYMILGILFIGIAGSLAYSITEKDFTEEIEKISIDGICEKEKTILGNYKSEICMEKEKAKLKGKRLEEFDIIIDQNIISITKNPKTEVIRIAVSPPKIEETKEK